MAATNKGALLTFGMFRLKTQQDATLVLKDQEGRVTSVSNQSAGEVQLGSWESKGPARFGGSRTLSASGRFGQVVAAWNLRTPPGS